jgi:hypothetical protein
MILVKVLLPLNNKSFNKGLALADFYTKPMNYALNTMNFVINSAGMKKS